jgi:hypothetical protein
LPYIVIELPYVATNEKEYFILCFISLGQEFSTPEGEKPEVFPAHN